MIITVPQVVLLGGPGPINHLAIDEIDPVRLGMIREVLAEHGYELRPDSQND